MVICQSVFSNTEKPQGLFMPVGISVAFIHLLVSNARELSMSHGRDMKNYHYGVGRA